MKYIFVAKEPGNDATIANLIVSEDSNLLTALQQFIGGYIEAIHIGTNVIILVDEDGLSKNLPDNCGFVGPILFVEQVFISDEEGYDFGSLSEENQRKALAWCHKHKDDLHPDRSGRMEFITGDAAIEEMYKQRAADFKAKVLEWESL